MGWILWLSSIPGITFPWRQTIGGQHLEQEKNAIHEWNKSIGFNSLSGNLSWTAGITILFCFIMMVDFVRRYLFGINTIPLLPEDIWVSQICCSHSSWLYHHRGLPGTFKNCGHNFLTAMRKMENVRSIYNTQHHLRAFIINSPSVRAISYIISQCKTWTYLGRKQNESSLPAFYLWGFFVRKTWNSTTIC